MFIDFFLFLKNDGLPVSLKEYLHLMEALDKGLPRYSTNKFYYLSRTILIKHERHLDRFDLLFGQYFKGVEEIDSEEFKKIPEEWLKRNMEKLLSEEDKKKIKAMGGLDKLMDRLKELMKEQEKRHEGGGKWIGTGGTSPFGAYGYNPEGIRIGQDGSRHRRAVKVWDKRQFRDLDENVELHTRNMKMALRNLRELSREGVPEVLDLEKTIKKTSKNAGLLELQMVPERKNNVKVILFFDVGGSMDDHIELTERLFSAARYEFKNMEYYYFHNCIYEGVWKSNHRRWKNRIPTYDVLHKYNNDYKVIIVGDASMSPYELSFAGGSVEHMNEEAGFTWLNRLKEHFPHMVWLNPVPSEEWKYTQSVKMLKHFMDDRMYPLTVNGVDKAMGELKAKSKG